METATILSNRDLFAACYGDTSPGFDYRHDGRLLHFRMEVPLGELGDYLRVIDRYNAFSASTVDAEVGAVLRRVQAGGAFVSVEVGREYSPVIYISARDHEAEVMAAGKRADADEIDMDGPYRVRLWWD